ncbi:MAG: LysM peptidoglycan-binding domain-containing protein [Candidatus Beckwithbacteria bacterium]|nr:LysM peptidoglycan-binding domain-containing protein [Patescibacteria group bacterium]
MNTFENKTSKLQKFLKVIRLNESLISIFLGGAVVVIVGVLIYNYFSSINKPVDQVEVIAEGVTLVEEDGKLIPEGLPKTHTVTKGEHLWSIAEKYYETGYNWVDIAKANNLINPEILQEGMELTIPKTAVIVLNNQKTIQDTLESEHTVVAGDTLWSIAVKAYGNGYKWTEVWQANKDQILNPNLIEKGMVLKLLR